MSRPASPERTALRQVLKNGFTGTREALAELAGVPADRVHTAMKELRREGEAILLERHAHRAGRPAVYGPCRAASFDALRFALQVWR